MKRFTNENGFNGSNYVVSNGEFLKWNAPSYFKGNEAMRSIIEEYSLEENVDYKTESYRRKDGSIGTLYKVYVNYKTETMDNGDTYSKAYVGSIDIDEVNKAFIKDNQDGYWYKAK